MDHISSCYKGDILNIYDMHVKIKKRESQDVDMMGDLCPLKAYLKKIILGHISIKLNIINRCHTCGINV